MTIHPFVRRLQNADFAALTGKVRRVMSTHIEADGPSLPLRAVCHVEATAGRGGQSGSFRAEVVAVGLDSIVLVPLELGQSTVAGALVTAWPGEGGVPVGDAFLGRAVDPMGDPIDGLGSIRPQHVANLRDAPTNALSRSSAGGQIETGIRAIDGLLPLGQGQRIGIFAASGAGKTSLMGQLTRQVKIDRCVICLIGERGYEVESLWMKGLSAEARSRSVLVAATADQPAAMRYRAAEYALSLANYWRHSGQQVLLLLDSATRLAMALREIGLAAGEPPTVRAYTPNVFAIIPRLIEQCGALQSGGAITAILTVLTETDDVEDPLAEMMKSLLDGHIVLSRGLAEKGSFPAIDIPRSISRWAGKLVDARHRTDIVQAVSALSTYEEARALIESGVYAAGGSAEIDRAIRLREGLSGFLRQDEYERSPFAKTRLALDAALKPRANDARI